MAVVVAVSAVMIFACCALAVDLGNGFARARALQSQADFAVLAGAAHLPRTGNEASIRAAVTGLATGNSVQGQDAPTWDFGDGDRSNGWLEFPTETQIRLLAPRARVDFAIAPAVGLASHRDLTAVATAEIQTPGAGLPFFISQTCGWGTQTILDPPSGPPSSDPTYVPVLVPTGASNQVKLASNPLSATTAVLDAEPFAITIDVQGNLNKVKFDGTTDNVAFTTESGDHIVLRGTKDSNSRMRATVPATVLSVEKVWWVRVIDEDGGLTADYAKFVVGTAETAQTSSCAGKNSGNFGSLNLSRNPNSNSTNLEYNMQFGIQHDLKEWVGPSYPATCATVAAAVMDNGTPTAGRSLNCLTTDSGSDLRQKATAAFIKNSHARLLQSENPTQCGRKRSVSVSGSYEINDDTLSCFFTNDTTTVGSVTSSTIAPANKHSISSAIFDSPRFFYIPVLVDDPSHGRSGSYAVVTMRPVFITEQADGATRVNPLVTSTNGVEIASNKIDRIKIRVINPDALPEFAPGDPETTIPYIGSGTKVVRLIE